MSISSSLLFLPAFFFLLHLHFPASWIVDNCQSLLLEILCFCTSHLCPESITHGGPHFVENITIVSDTYADFKRNKLWLCVDLFGELLFVYADLFDWIFPGPTLRVFITHSEVKQRQRPALCFLGAVSLFRFSVFPLHIKTHNQSVSFY